MEITDIRMRLVNDRTDRLKAFCSVTFDDEFVIRDVKVVDGTNGLFIAMPSRKLSAACPQCRHKNQVRARYCEECGKKLRMPPVSEHPADRMTLYRDIAHPITSAFREKLQARIIEAYHAECDRARDAHDREAGADLEQDSAQDSARDGDDHETGADLEKDSAREPTEYDALIADLRGNSEEPSAQERDRSPVSVQGPAEGRRRDEDSGSPGGEQQRKRGPRRRSSPERGGDAAEPVSAVEGDATTPEPPASDQGTLQTTSSEPQAKEPAAESPAEPKTDREDHVRLDEVMTESTGSDDASEDSTTPFGAGVL